MASDQQKAIAVTAIGKPVELVQRAIPLPKEGEVLVKVKATHLLPHDSYQRDRGLFVADKLPYGLGADVAGTIEKLGSSSTSFKVGDRIVGVSNLAAQEPDQMGLQEYATLQMDSITKILDGVKKEDAVTLPVNLATSFVALFTEKMGFGFPAPWEKTDFDFASQTIVLLGAGSNVAKLAVQLAKIAGIGRVICIAGPSNEEELKRLGATHVINRHGSDEEIKKQVYAVTGSEGATHVYDCASWNYDLATSLMSDSKPSRLLTLHRLDAETVAKAKPLCRGNFIAGSNASLAPHIEQFWKHLPIWLEKKHILPASWKIIGNLDAVDEINKVLDEYRDGKGGPQAIVTP